MRKTIPDLRPEITEISLDHCSVLLERLKYALDVLECMPGVGDFIFDVDPNDMKVFYESLYAPEEFGRLFMTDLGKGILLGTLMTDMISQFTLEEDDSEGE